ncbi:hypothetical protein J4O15_08650 [Lachnoanaerobaculum sp. Marseille-Q4761]|uniref:hypothetical protein n=1 Tax=Lachnoanaerobaculum sp. Marseille-Q4761 TaxID=2819511 RepID=UPI001AA1C4D8|nr:hypothetical protein [Lachnoanaerobaculum sp. Marseille-Q4761]MBO1871000.1 hypothetical protein [Lachnoanaerobaculum sp. Marseille-Q4761]
MGIFYSRLSNPTNDAVARKIYQLEVVVVVGSGNFESKRNIQRYISYKTKTLIPLKH